MTHEVLWLTPEDPEPTLACDRGVSAIGHDRRVHVVDRSVLVVDGGSLVARASCWWRQAPSLEHERAGVIGHYAAADSAAAAAVLAAACRELAAHGCTIAVGPMDGTTWRRYRLIVDRGTEPPFFLEPDNPDEWPSHWTGAGFTPLASYSSAIVDDLAREDPRTEPALAALASAGVTVRAFDPSSGDEDLRRIFALSLSAFRRNFLYTPIGEAEFLAQYRAVLPYVRPELVLLAEQGGDLAGFVFAVPDLLQARRGSPVDTVVVKSMAVDPAKGGQGLGGALIDLVQRAARALGYRRAVHALMHDDNRSRRISNRYARTIRRYALFSRRLQP